MESSERWDEEATREWWDGETAHLWRRVGEQGTEAGLREVGCSETRITETVRYLSVEAFDSKDFKVHNLLSDLSSTKDGPAVLLATLGRGISSGMKRFAYPATYTGPRFPRNASEAAALCVNLSSNTSIKELDLSRNLMCGSRLGYTLLATALETNSAIQSLLVSACTIGPAAVRCLMYRLRANKTLTSLDISSNQLQDEGIEAVAEFLSANDTLKRLNLSWTIRGSGSSQHHDSAIHLASALERNTALEELNVGGNTFSSFGMNRLLQPLYGVIGDATGSSNGPKNRTLKILDLADVEKATIAEPLVVEPIGWMIRTNRNLSTLRMGRTALAPEEWKDQIFAALKENETLEELDLSGCSGIDKNDLLNLLQFSSTGLRRVNLRRSDIESGQGQVDEEIRLNVQFRSQLRGQTQVQLVSGRLVLCGYEFAGKTAIRTTMERIEHGTPCAHPLRMGWKKVMQAAPGLRSFLFGRDAHRELTTRTRGFDILVLRQQEYLASVWDFAGQREYYALHDYLFPNVINSCFLYVCSSRCPPDLKNPQGRPKDRSSIKEECEYWMRFIASNSKPCQVGDGAGPQLPQVRFVLTHKDTLDFDTLNISKQLAEDVVGVLREKFQNVIALCETVEVINAHSLEDVERLVTLTNATLKEILVHQTEYSVCKAVRTAMENWSMKNPSTPVLSLAEFGEMCRNQVGPLAPMAFKDAHLHSQDGREAVLAYLNDVGDLIFPTGLKFIVANPRWFGVGVLGSLINALGAVDDFDQSGVSVCSGVLVRRPKRFWKLHHEEGFVERRNIKNLLKHSLQTMNLQQIIPPDQLIQLMIHLELCFENDPGNEESSLFIPALFDDETESAARGRRQLQWKLERTEPLHYLGRRLECENKAITFLTPGFFPRLQVHLRNYIHERKWVENSGFGVGRNLICFAENGVEVCVEYSGDIDYFVDILVRSSKPFDVALQFIDEHVVKKIVQFCATPQGCQGVVLVEAVIRPNMCPGSSPVCG